MPYPTLTDAQALAAARSLHLRQPDAVLRSPLLRQAVELAHWARQRTADAALQRYRAQPDFKRIAAADGNP
ncbi:MAG: hypothetical protein KGL42_08610 [Betaproteobacteria bacterium]|nr:hypothetical protein [Betaproteobacteria bacterium]